MQKNSDFVGHWLIVGGPNMSRWLRVWLSCYRYWCQCKNLFSYLISCIFLSKEGYLHEKAVSRSHTKHMHSMLTIIWLYGCYGKKPHRAVLKFSSVLCFLSFFCIVFKALLSILVYNDVTGICNRNILLDTPCPYKV